MRELVVVRGIVEAEISGRTSREDQSSELARVEAQISELRAAGIKPDITPVSGSAAQIRLARTDPSPERRLADLISAAQGLEAILAAPKRTTVSSDAYDGVVIGQRLAPPRL